MANEPHLNATIGRPALPRSNGGFSLVEVSLAVLLVGAGVLTLFALFPAGLKQADLAVEDTHIGLFAEQALTGLRAEAMKVSDFQVWTNQDDFQQQVVDKVPIYYQPGSTYLIGDGRQQKIANFLKQGVGMCYILAVTNVIVDMQGEPFGKDRYKHVRVADLRVCFGNHFVTNEAQWFYTEFFYGGMP
ncbi:MAG: hypothetical protein QME60_00140 [Verrucomicrobiota bacterium]|nr:hypothetical protein [Verrucomicrobiota bacterium]